MKEQGVVIEVTGDMVKVRLMQKPQCAQCGMCSAAGGGYQILSIKTQKPFNLNQIVSIEVNRKILTLSTILLYGMPLFGFVAGAIAGYIIGKELMATVFAFGLMTVDLIAAKILIKNLRLSEKVAEIK